MFCDGGIGRNSLRHSARRLAEVSVDNELGRIGTYYA